MSLDVQNANVVAGGETHQPPPFNIEGLRLLPSVETLCSQATGTGAVVLMARITAGRARVVDYATDFRTDEYVVVNEAAQYGGVTSAGLASGRAVWFAVIALQHRPTGAVDILFVPGDIAAVASAAVPTLDEVEEFFETSDSDKRYAILGDIRFHRSADTAIQVEISEERRPAYVDEDNKSGVLFSQGSVSDLAAEFGCFMDIPIELISTSAVADNGTYINGLALPRWPFGGFVRDWQYIPTKAGTNSSATNTLRLALDGTDMTGNDLTVTLALSAIGQIVNGDGSFSGSTNVFKSGDTLDVEVVSSATDFTAGQGFLHVELWKYVP